MGLDGCTFRSSSGGCSARQVQVQVQVLDRRTFISKGKKVRHVICGPKFKREGEQ